MICYVQEISIHTCTTHKKFHLYQNIYYMYHLEAVKETTVSLSKLAPMRFFSTGNKILVHQAIIKQNAKLSNSNEEYSPDHGWSKSCIGKQVFIFCVTVMRVFVHKLFGIYSLSRGKISVMWLNICAHEKHWFQNIQRVRATITRLNQVKLAAAQLSCTFFMHLVISLV